MAAVTRPLTDAGRVDARASTTGAASAGLVAPNTLMGIIPVLWVAPYDVLVRVGLLSAARRLPAMGTVLLSMLRRTAGRAQEQPPTRRPTQVDPAAWTASAQPAMLVPRRPGAGEQRLGADPVLPTRGRVMGCSRKRPRLSVGFTKQ